MTIILPFSDSIIRTRCATTTSTSYEIGDLENGREYAFAVIATNEVLYSYFIS